MKQSWLWFTTPCSRGHTSNLNVNRSTNKANHRNHSTVAVNTYASNSNSQSLLSSHLCFRYLAPPRRPLRVPPWLRCAASSARHRPCWVTGRRPAAAGWPPGRWREPAAPATALPPPRRRPPRRPPVYQEKLSQTMCGCCEGSRLSHEHCSAAAATSPSAPPPCDCRGHRCRGVSTHVGVKRHCIMQRQYKPAGIESAARACVPARPTGTARRQTLPPFSIQHPCKQLCPGTAVSAPGSGRRGRRAGRAPARAAWRGWQRHAPPCRASPPRGPLPPTPPPAPPACAEEEAVTFRLIRFEIQDVYLLSGSPAAGLPPPATPACALCWCYGASTKGTSREEAGFHSLHEIRQQMRAWLAGGGL